MGRSALGASYFNGTIAAGSWHVYIAGATGAARDLLLVDSQVLERK